MNGIELAALLLAVFGALAASALFLVGAWQLMRGPHWRTHVARARDLVTGSAYPRKLGRASHNPVLPPSPHPWEAAAVLNPAAIDDGERVHLFYRAIGVDGVSRIGYASAADGIHFDTRLPFPVFATQDDPRNAARMFAHSRFSGLVASGGSWSGVEDPRAVVIEDRLYLTFNSFRDWAMRIGMTTLPMEDVRKGRWNWSRPAFLSPPGQVHKNWLIFPRKIGGKYAVLHGVSPTPEVAYVDDLAAVGVTEPYIESTEGARTAPVEGGWEQRVRGAGPPPIETPDGWLVLYHAHDSNPAHYKLGAMLLDLAHPEIVLARAAAPILEPEALYENSGAKPGIVYACGAVVRDGMLLVYYGGADNVVCMAAAPLADFIAQLKAGKAPKLSASGLPVIPRLPTAFEKTHA